MVCQVPASRCAHTAFEPLAFPVDARQACGNFDGLVRSFRLALLARGFSRARSSLALFATFAVVRSRSLEGIPRLRVLQSYCLNAPGRRSVCGTKRKCPGAHRISGAEG